MSTLSIFLLMAFLLLWALLAFLDADHSAPSPDNAPVEFTSAGSSASDNRDFAALGDLVFSDQDWEFIKREESPFLDKLFIQERRAVVTHWLRESAARLRAIREDHVQHSRLSKNLDVIAEGRLLLLFFYLGFLCWFLLLIVRVVHPSAPRALALHFHSTASRVLFSAGGAFVPVAPDPNRPLSP